MIRKMDLLQLGRRGVEECVAHPGELPSRDGVASDRHPVVLHDRRAPITDHLTELRKRIFWILITMVIFSVAAFSYSEQIFLFLMDPAVKALGEKGARLQAIAPTETFFTYLKCALLAGFVCSLPVTFWQIWAFIAPGLYAN
ncbi:MAG: twin-arginine translocase subunit TatC, partial [Planctomycetota bacterium]